MGEWGGTAAEGRGGSCARAHRRSLAVRRGPAVGWWRRNVIAPTQPGTGLAGGRNAHTEAACCKLGLLLHVEPYLRRAGRGRIGGRERRAAAHANSPPSATPRRAHSSEEQHRTTALHKLAQHCITARTWNSFIGFGSVVLTSGNISECWRPPPAVIHCGGSRAGQDACVQRGVPSP